MTSVKLPAVAPEGRLARYLGNSKRARRLGDALRRATLSGVDDPNIEVAPLVRGMIKRAGNARVQVAVDLPEKVRLRLQHEASRLRHSLPSVTIGDVAVAYAASTIAKTKKLKPENVMEKGAIKESQLISLLFAAANAILDSKAPAVQKIRKGEREKVEKLQNEFTEIMSGRVPQRNPDMKGKIFNPWAEGAAVSELTGLFSAIARDVSARDGELAGLQAVLDEYPKILNSGKYTAGAVEKAVLHFVTESDIARRHIYVPPLFVRQPGLVPWNDR